MRFVFSRKFLILLAAGLIPLSLSWNFPALRRVVLAYDVLLVLSALADYFASSRLPEGIGIRREFARRFVINDEIQVILKIENRTSKTFQMQIKDEFPSEMRLVGKRQRQVKSEGQTEAQMSYDLIPPKRGRYEFGKTAVRFRSRFGLVWCQTYLNKTQIVKVYPNMRRAREAELKALGANSYLAVQR